MSDVARRCGLLVTLALRWRPAVAAVSPRGVGRGSVNFSETATAEGRHAGDQIVGRRTLEDEHEAQA